MEFASEMIIRALQNRLRIKELAINYHSRKGQSKLKSFPDGWRHLRFMLMYAPNYLFFIPGALFFVAGLFLIFFFKNNVVYGCFCIILGYQIISLGIFTKTYMKSLGLIKISRVIDYLAKIIKFESGIILASLFLLAAFVISQKKVFDFIVQYLNMPSHSLIIITFTIAALAIQTVFSVFLVSIMLVEKNEKS